MRCIFLTISVLALIGCGSKDEDAPVQSDTFRVVTNQETLTFSTSGKEPYLPPCPDTCQAFTVTSENGLITFVSPLMGIEKQKQFEFRLPTGLIKSVYVTPNFGYRFDGWYRNGVKVIDFTIPYKSDDVVINAVMIPVAIQ